MSTRLHQTLEFIEEDFNAGRITFREALAAYEEFLEEEFRATYEDAAYNAYNEGREDARQAL